jgi:pimeloyl-ACP methyl ester carboxylesterase
LATLTGSTTIAFSPKRWPHGEVGLLAISYRGFRSTGTPSEIGLLTDGVAAFGWPAAESKSQIILLGQSFGSGVTVDIARRRPAIVVILVSGYLSVLSLAQTIYPYFPVALLIKDPFRSDLRIKRSGNRSWLSTGDVTLSFRFPRARRYDYPA